jgi:hypothetical protein
VMILFAVLVKVTSRGPIFYRQVRRHRQWQEWGRHDCRRTRDFGGIIHIRQARRRSWTPRTMGAVRTGDPRVTPPAALCASASMSSQLLRD